MQDTKIIAIFCTFDNFYKDFDRFLDKNTICHGRPRRRRKGMMSMAEVMTIITLFHISGYRTFKDFYLKYVCKHLRNHLPDVVSYNPMVALQSRTALPLAIFLKMYHMGECSGVSSIDSTPIAVCHNRRIHQHKIFRGPAKRGKSSKGWFYVSCT